MCNYVFVFVCHISILKYSYNIHSGLFCLLIPKSYFYIYFVQSIFYYSNVFVYKKHAFFAVDKHNVVYGETKIDNFYDIVFVISSHLPPLLKVKSC